MEPKVSKSEVNRTNDAKMTKNGTKMEQNGTKKEPKWNQTLHLQSQKGCKMHQNINLRKRSRK